MSLKKGLSMSIHHELHIVHGMSVKLRVGSRTMTGVVEGFPYCNCPLNGRCGHDPNVVGVVVHTGANNPRLREVEISKLHLA